MPLIMTLLDVKWAKDDVRPGFAHRRVDEKERGARRSGASRSVWVRITSTTPSVLSATPTHRLEHAEMAIAVLIGVLRARPRTSDRRWSTADALGKFGPAAAAALPYLETVLNDADENLRRSASGAIAKNSQ